MEWIELPEKESDRQAKLYSLKERLFQLGLERNQIVAEIEALERSLAKIYTLQREEEDCYQMNERPSVREIVKDYLVKHGYDGLYSPAGQCGCDLDDLMPCDSPCDSCIPGYKIDDPTGEADFIIVREKEEP